MPSGLSGPHWRVKRSRDPVHRSSRRHDAGPSSASSGASPAIRARACCLRRPILARRLAASRAARAARALAVRRRRAETGSSGAGLSLSAMAVQPVYTAGSDSQRPCHRQSEMHLPHRRADAAIRAQDPGKSDKSPISQNRRGTLLKPEMSCLRQPAGCGSFRARRRPGFQGQRAGLSFQAPVDPAGCSSSRM